MNYAPAFCDREIIFGHQSRRQHARDVDRALEIRDHSKQLKSKETGKEQFKTRKKKTKAIKVHVRRSRHCGIK
jgi:hypothetical protein